jgi:hypothetical protein
LVISEERLRAKGGEFEMGKGINPNFNPVEFDGVKKKSETTDG